MIVCPAEEESLVDGGSQAHHFGRPEVQSLNGTPHPCLGLSWSAGDSSPSTKSTRRDLVWLLSFSTLCLCLLCTGWLGWHKLHSAQLRSSAVIALDEVSCNDVATKPVVCKGDLGPRLTKAAQTLKEERLKLDSMYKNLLSLRETANDGCESDLALLGPCTPLAGLTPGKSLAAELPESALPGQLALKKGEPLMVAKSPKALLLKTEASYQTLFKTATSSSLDLAQQCKEVLSQTSSVCATAEDSFVHAEDGTSKMLDMVNELVEGGSGTATEATEEVQQKSAQIPVHWNTQGGMKTVWTPNVSGAGTWQWLPSDAGDRSLRAERKLEDEDLVAKRKYVHDLAESFGAELDGMWTGNGACKEIADLSQDCQAHSQTLPMGVNATTRQKNEAKAAQGVCWAVGHVLSGCFKEFPCPGDHCSVMTGPGSTWKVVIGTVKNLENLYNSLYFASSTLREELIGHCDGGLKKAQESCDTMKVDAQKSIDNANYSAAAALEMANTARPVHDEVDNQALVLRLQGIQDATAYQVVGAHRTLQQDLTERHKKWHATVAGLGNVHTGLFNHCNNILNKVKGPCDVLSSQKIQLDKNLANIDELAQKAEDLAKTINEQCGDAQDNGAMAMDLFGCATRLASESMPQMALKSATLEDAIQNLAWLPVVGCIIAGVLSGLAWKSSRHLIPVSVTADQLLLVCLVVLLAFRGSYLLALTAATTLIVLAHRFHKLQKRKRFVEAALKCSVSTLEATLGWKEVWLSGLAAIVLQACFFDVVLGSSYYLAASFKVPLWSVLVPLLLAAFWVSEVISNILHVAASGAVSEACGINTTADEPGLWAALRSSFCKERLGCVVASSSVLVVVFGRPSSLVQLSLHSELGKGESESALESGGEEAKRRVLREGEGALAKVADPALRRLLNACQLSVPLGLIFYTVALPTNLEGGLLMPVFVAFTIGYALSSTPLGILEGALGGLAVASDCNCVAVTSLHQELAAQFEAVLEKH